MFLISKNKWKLSIFSIALIVFSTASFAQKLNSGPQVSSFRSEADDTEQPYGLYLPKNYNPANKYPLVVMLHGAGSNHRLALKRVFGKSNLPGESDVETSRYFPEWKDVEYIVVSPYARGTMGYQGIAEKDVMDILADVKKKFSIDEDRTYLTGLSMGGGGSLWIGLSRPDIWAAIAPVCPAPPEGTKELLPNALNIPMHFFQGDADKAVNVDSTRNIVKLLKEAGTQLEYIEYPGVGHDSWVNAYKDEFVFDWFSKFRRNRFPNEVRFVTSQYKHSSAYWVVFNEFTPGKAAKIDAKFTSENKIEISTSELKTFTLNLEGHPKFKSGIQLEIVINGKKIKTQATNSITITQNDKNWVIGSLTKLTSSKKAGAEGPLTEAISDRHIYVYGTGGNPSNEELNSRREIAAKAADWSVNRGDFLGRVMVFPRVLSDKEVRPSDIETASLILFGTKETNKLIEKYSDKLPLELSVSAIDLGLTYIFPNGKQYVVVSSGLPFFTVPDPNPANGISRLVSPLTLNTLRKFGDYFLFNKTTVIIDSRFDNNWHLQPKDAEKIKSAGVIVK